MNNENRSFLIDTVKGTAQQVTACYIITDENDARVYYGKSGEMPTPNRTPRHVVEMRVKNRDAIERLESLRSQ